MLTVLFQGVRGPATYSFTIYHIACCLCWFHIYIMILTF